MINPGRVVILGAGPTGLGAAYRLQQLGHDDFFVIERAGHPGGLAGSEVDDQGFTWDVGGHVQFSHYAYYDRVLDSLDEIQWLHHERESWVWLDGRFVPYPFQNNIHRLAPADCDRVLRGMEEAEHVRPSLPLPANLGQWIMYVFGAGMAEVFLVPYNKKVWAYAPEQLGTQWMGDRISVPDLARVRRSIAEGRDDVSWGPNNTFRFPLRGATGAIWRGVSARIASSRLAYGEAVQSIGPVRRVVKTSRGREIGYDTLISSLPMVELARRVEGLAPKAVRAAESLVFSSTHVFGVGLRGGMPETLARKCWMYFPEATSPYYRVTVFSNYSPRNVPDGDGYWSLMAEVSESPAKAVDHRTVYDDVIEAMARDKLITAETEIVSRYHRFEPYGYPTPTVERDAALNVVQPALEKLRIFSRGRFGAWKYEVSNQDHSFMQGVELVNRLTGEGEEYTISRPDYVNSGAFLREAART